MKSQICENNEQHEKRDRQINMKERVHNIDPACKYGRSRE